MLDLAVLSSFDQAARTRPGEADKTVTGLTTGSYEVTDARPVACKRAPPAADESEPRHRRGRSASGPGCPAGLGYILTVSFDEPNLVSHAGLVPVAELAQRLRVGERIDGDGHAVRVARGQPADEPGPLPDEQGNAGRTGLRPGPLAEGWPAYSAVRPEAPPGQIRAETAAQLGDLRPSDFLRLRRLVCP
jgi:hypothetical protein